MLELQKSGAITEGQFKTDVINSILQNVDEKYKISGNNKDSKSLLVGKSISDTTPLLGSSISDTTPLLGASSTKRMSIAKTPALKAILEDQSWREKGSPLNSKKISLEPSSSINSRGGSSSARLRSKSMDHSTRMLDGQLLDGKLLDGGKSSNLFPNYEVQADNVNSLHNMQRRKEEFERTMEMRKWRESIEKVFIFICNFWM